jgi:diketogulonate reductase-like aldo/keto reductase
VFDEYCGGSNPKIPRADLFVTSKVWNTSHSRSQVSAALDRTLADLQLSYLDLYLVHHPFAWAHVGLSITGDNWIPHDASDPWNIKWAEHGVTLEETWRSMEDVHDSGKAKNIGVANYSAPLLMDMLRYARVKPAVHQFECHPMFQRTELRAFGDKLGIHSTMYSILGSGKTGPMQDSVIAGIAKKHGVSAAAVCIAWGLSQNCSVLSKSTTPARIVGNYGAQDVSLDAEDMKQIASCERGLRTCNTEEYWGFASHA